MKIKPKDSIVLLSLKERVSAPKRRNQTFSVPANTLNTRGLAQHSKRAVHTTI